MDLSDKLHEYTQDNFKIVLEPEKHEHRNSSSSAIKCNICDKYISTRSYLTILDQDIVNVVVEVILSKAIQDAYFEGAKHSCYSTFIFIDDKLNKSSFEKKINLSIGCYHYKLCLVIPKINDHFYEDEIYEAVKAWNRRLGDTD